MESRDTEAESSHFFPLGSFSYLMGGKRRYKLLEMLTGFFLFAVQLWLRTCGSCISAQFTWSEQGQGSYTGGLLHLAEPQMGRPENSFLRILVDKCPQSVFHRSVIYSTNLYEAPLIGSGEEQQRTVVVKEGT